MKINFTHAEGGILEDDGASLLSPMMQLGALAHTAVRGVFATDSDGLDEALEAAESASNTYAGHVQSIGQLMANASENINKDVANDIGWMLTAFGQSLIDLGSLQMNLSEAINKAKEDAQKAAKKGGV
jgi:hypothetical protein